MKQSHKFKITFNKTVQERKAIDKKNEDKYWKETIANEMKNAMVIIQIYPNDEKRPNDSKLANQRRRPQ